MGVTGGELTELRWMHEGDQQGFLNWIEKRISVLGGKMNALTNAQIARQLKITPILDKITGIQEKLDTACK